MTGTVVRPVWAEVCWWSRLLTRLGRRSPGVLIAMAGVAWLLAVSQSVSVAAVLLAGVVLLRWAAVRWPVSVERWVTGPPVRVWRRWWMHRHWPEVAERCGLAHQSQPRTRDGKRCRRRRDHDEDPVVEVPRLVRTRATGPRVVLRVRPVLGQTVEDLQAAAERLRTAVSATRARIEPHGVSEALVTFTIGDPLAVPFHAARPESDGPVCTESVCVGRVEDGSGWRLPVGPHTLVAGCSGAGKGSVFWSFAFALAPGVKAGVVRLYGIDLKGGMEILMGQDLFCMHATNAEAVVVLESLVEQMHERTRRYAGQVRTHTATVAEPLQVVMIDELAALTAYCPDRGLQRRAELAINLLCSQGRAPGFVVFACLQDPRKEVIPSRGLFTQMIGLRLKDASETVMVLGETAAAQGAACHQISRAMPGVGYVVPEDGSTPLRVRAGMTPDHTIRAVAAEFAAPLQLPVVVSPEAQPETLGSGPRAGAAGRRTGAG